MRDPAGCFISHGLEPVLYIAKFLATKKKHILAGNSESDVSTGKTCCNVHKRATNLSSYEDQQRNSEHVLLGEGWLRSPPFVLARAHFFFGYGRDLGSLRNAENAIAKYETSGKPKFSVENLKKRASYGSINGGTPMRFKWSKNIHFPGPLRSAP